MINERNASYIYVANALNGIADEAAFDGMAAGSVAIVRAADNKNEESALSGSTLVRVVQKKADGTYVFSPYFSAATISEKYKVAHVGPVEQVSFWGYDGTSNTTGFPTISTGNTYSLHMVLNHTRNTLNNAPQIKTVPYKALTTSQADMAKGLQEQFLRTFSDTREFYPSIVCERTSDASAVAAIADSATVYLLTKGSTTVYTYTKAAAANTTLTASQVDVTLANIVNAPTSNGRTFTFSAVADVSHAVYIGTHSIYVADANTANDGTDNATAIVAAINLATNSISTVASASADGATVTVTYKDNFKGLPPLVLSNVGAAPALVAVTIATGDAVPVKYKIAATATNSATFELDVPWQGETGYVYEGTTAATNIGIATVTGYWGLKFTGVKQPWNPIEDSLTNQKVYFDITSEDFGTLTEYKAQKMNPGVGTYEQVSYQEIYSQFIDKSPIVSTRPRTKYRLESVEGNGYTLYNFKVLSSDIHWNATGINNKSYVNITIALKDTLATDITAMDTILAVS